MGNMVYIPGLVIPPSPGGWPCGCLSPGGFPRIESKNPFRMTIDAAKKVNALGALSFAGIVVISIIIGFVII